MTRAQYIRMTEGMRALLSRLPGGEKFLRLPTLLCACAYIFSLVFLMLRRDARLVRVLLVPAACFLAVTALRPLIGRQRPYDRFGAPPVGRYRPGKGKSMPSRHTASAAAIACAVIAVFPTPAVCAAMLALCALIAALRVLSGQHYISDVVAALALSFALSLAGYLL
ncbi:MAG: phosphatase PAP2 family protein [Clostridia bacterium]|nr:phosphatase PAP2 family protein [Clostridia bacterium]